MFRRLTQALRRLTRRIPGAGGDVPSSRETLFAHPAPQEDRPRPRPAARRASARAARPTRYFDLHDDFRHPARRELSDPVGPDGRKSDSVWLFTSGAPVEPPRGRLQVTPTPEGPPLDFSLAGAGLTPIVHARAATVFRELAPDDVQLLPVDVEGTREPYFVLVATRLVPCIDDRACAEASRYTADEAPAEKVGHYRTVRGLRIDARKAAGVRVLRTWGWPVSLIVSEGIKEALEHAGVTGLRFAEVTAPPTPSRRRKARRKSRR